MTYVPEFDLDYIIRDGKLMYSEYKAFQGLDYTEVSTYPHPSILIHIISDLQDRIEVLEACNKLLYSRLDNQHTIKIGM